MRCVSSTYKPVPELHWLLDGQPLESQYLDYGSPNDYHLNEYVSIEAKYQLRGRAAYHFECVQVLSDVISVATEVAELYNFYEQHSSNSVEAGKCCNVCLFTDFHAETCCFCLVKSLIGNGAISLMGSYSLAFLVVFSFLVANIARHHLI